MLQFLESPSAAITLYKSLGEVFHNLFAIFSAGIVQHILFDSHTHMPIHPTRLGIDIHSHTIAGVFYDGAHVIIEF